MVKVRYALFILTFCLLIPLKAFAAEPEAMQYGDFEYSITNKTVTILKYDGKDEEVTIPSVINGYPVTAIGESAFAANSNVKNVSVSDGITAIKDFAFDSCTGLKEIILPEGLSYLGNNAFHECTSLKSVSLPSSILTVHGYAFIESGIEELVIPEGVKYIDGSFSHCSKLQSVSLPASLEYIYPDETIGLFYCCQSLKEINVAEENPYYFSKSGVFFQRDTVKENGSRQYLYSYPAARPGKTYTVPKNTYIMICAFDSCKYLRSLIIPEGIKNISIIASNCKNITITVPHSIITFPSNGHQYDYPLLKNCTNSRLKVYKGSAVYKYCRKYKFPYILIKE